MAGGRDFNGWTSKKPMRMYLYGAPVASGGDLTAHAVWMRWYWTFPAPWLLDSDARYTIKAPARNYTIQATL